MRRVARAADDGYHHDLVPGLRASEDARRLASEIAFSVARLEELRADPPGLYAEVALLAGEDREEAIWLAFLIAYVSPLEGAAEDPWEGVRAARVPWASGELPPLDVPAGPRTSLDPSKADRTIAAYRAWASKAGSQAGALLGEPSWPAQRRFDRAYERLSLPGLNRAARYEFLLLCSYLGLADMAPGSLLLGEAVEPTTLAAKRVFGMGDALILRQRSAALATALSVPIESLDLALVNWANGDPDDHITAGATAEPADETRDRLAAVLGVSA